jgi:hypothetical protein
MATDVDHRYLQRVFLPAAAAFVSGLANAVAESGATTITIQGETVTESEEDKSNDQEVASGSSKKSWLAICIVLNTLSTVCVSKIACICSDINSAIS